MNTIQELIETINSKRGHSFIGVTAETQAQKSKAKSAQVVHKVSTFTASLNADYQKACNKRSESEFKADSTYYHPVAESNGVGIVKHKTNGTLYLRVIFFKGNGATQDPRFFIEGKEVAKESVSHLLREHVSSVKQANAGIAPQDEIVVRIFKLENICSIKIDGETIVLKESLAEKADKATVKNLEKENV